MELPFAGLHQLCAPMLAGLDGLPEPQQRALRVALGLASGDAPDRFLVALGALTLLAEVAEEQPLLCFVDDAQWLDDASRQVLGFVARRLLAEPVAIVFAVRDAERGCRARRPARAARSRAWTTRTPARCSRRVVPGRLDERVRDRIVAETRGNPLALLELPRGLSAGTARRRLRAARSWCRSRAASRRASYAASRSCRRDADPAPGRGGRTRWRPVLMWRAADAAGDPGTAIEPAARAELLDDRCTGPLPPSTGAIDRLSIGLGLGPPARARRPGGGDRCRRSTRIAAPGTARRPRRARRGGRARARALGRSRAGPRRARGRRGIPGAGGRADRRPGTAAPSACWRRRRSTCRPARSTPRSGCWSPGRPGPLTSSGAPVQTCCTPRSRSRRTAAATHRSCCSEPRRRSSRSTRGSRGRPISTPGARRCSPGGSRTPAACSRSPGRSDRPQPDAPAAPVGPASGRLRARVHRGAARRRRRCCSALRRRSPVPISRWRRSSGGDGWRRRPPCSCGTTTPVSRSPPARSSSPASRVRSRSSPSPSTCSARPSALGGDFASAGAAGRRGRCGHGGHGSQRRPLRGARARRLPRPEADASELIEATIKEATAGRPGHRCPVRALGERRPA